MVSKKYAVRRLIRRTGWDIVRFRREFEEIQAGLLSDERIDRLVDVGANEGQYSQRMRQLGFRDGIVAFEPLTAAFNKLVDNFAGDGAFSAIRSAIGDEDGECSINVSENSVSSSLLPMLDAHLDADPHSRYVSVERVPVARLDTQEIHGSRLWLKLDVQGAELAALMGAAQLLKRTRVVQIELSLKPLYDGSWLIEETIAWLRGAGFVPVAIEPGFSRSDTGEMLQAEGLFRRGSV